MSNPKDNKRKNEEAIRILEEFKKTYKSLLEKSGTHTEVKEGSVEGTLVFLTDRNNLHRIGAWDALIDSLESLRATYAITTEELRYKNPATYFTASETSMGVTVSFIIITNN